MEKRSFTFFFKFFERPVVIQNIVPLRRFFLRIDLSMHAGSYFILINMIPFLYTPNSNRFRGIDDYNGIKISVHAGFINQRGLDNCHSEACFLQAGCPARNFFFLRQDAKSPRFFFVLGGWKKF